MQMWKRERKNFFTKFKNKLITSQILRRLQAYLSNRISWFRRFQILVCDIGVCRLKLNAKTSLRQWRIEKKFCPLKSGLTVSFQRKRALSSSKCLFEKHLPKSISYNMHVCGMILHVLIHSQDQITNTIIKFRKHLKTIKVPWVIYFYFDCNMCMYR